MGEVVRIDFPIDAEVAQALNHLAGREAAGRLPSGLLREGGVREALANAIAEAKREARANGLTDEEIDAELEAWRAERSVPGSARLAPLA